MNPPIYKTPAFWRGLAAEWRRPETESTHRGICVQLIDALYHLRQRDMVDAAIDFLYTFDPTQGMKGYFFLIGDRTSRANLCDHIADTLEKEQQ